MRARDRRLAVAVVAAAVIVIAGAALALASFSSRPPAAAAPPAASQPPAGAAPPAPSPGRGGRQEPAVTAGGPHGASVPLSALPAGRRVVTLVIVSGAPSLAVRVAPPGPAGAPAPAVQASTAPGYGARPALTVEAAPGGGSAVVGLSLDPAAATGAGGTGAASLTVALSPRVAWQLDFGGGTSQTSVDMRGGQVAGLSFGAGSSGISVALPRPASTVVLRLEGGASQLAVSVPGGVPARVTAGGGAARVSVGGHGYTGIAAGTVITQPGWGSARGRLDVDATSGVSQVAVTAP
jgi:hypothetical protein